MAPTPRYTVEKNGPRDYVKESRTSNRVYTGWITTWDVVDTQACSVVSEHRTKREADAALATLQARIPVERDGRLLGWLEPYYAATKGRLRARPEWFAILPTGRRTWFTLPTRKQAVEWLEGAAR